MTADVGGRNGNALTGRCRGLSASARGLPRLVAGRYQRPRGQVSGNQNLVVRTIFVHCMQVEGNRRGALFGFSLFDSRPAHTW
jgi:hypothetical protein